MVDEARIREMRGLVEGLRKTAQALKDQAGDFPALDRNAIRLLASIRMLEINLGMD